MIYPHAIQEIKRSLSYANFMEAQTDRDAVEESIRSLYATLGYPPPTVLWLHSPAAAEYIWGMVLGGIPGWFHPQRLNPDLYAHDPDVPDRFFDSLDDILPHVSPRGCLNAGLRSKSLVYTILREIDEHIPPIVKMNLHRFWSAARDVLEGYEPKVWQGLIPETGRHAMPTQAKGDVWMAWGMACPDTPIKSPDLTHAILSKNAIARNCAVWYPFQCVVLAVGQPDAIRFRGESIHSDGTPAVHWADGVKSWFLNGTAVPRWVAKMPSDEIPASAITMPMHPTVRCELVRKIGIERICLELGATCIDQCGDYELLLLDVEIPEEPRDIYDPATGGWLPSGKRSRPYLKMKNPSTGTYHIEGVHPTCRSVHAALVWRNGMDVLPHILS